MTEDRRMSSNWYQQYKIIKEEVENKLSILKLTSNNPTKRYHPYERNEEEQRERRVKCTADPSTTTSSNPMVGAIKKNLESLGGVIPRAGWGGGNVKRVDSAPNDSLALNGSEPATGVPDTLQRRAIRGSHRGDAFPASKAVAATQLTYASACTEGDQAYQPLPIRPIANSPVASAPAYTVELVSVAPGVQIQKKKFLPRYLPMPIGTPPGGLGRPILGRGALLYSLTPQPDLPSALAAQGNNGRNRSESLSAEASAQSSSVDGDMSSSSEEPAEFHPLRVKMPKWPFTD